MGVCDSRQTNDQGMTRYILNEVLVYLDEGLETFFCVVWVSKMCSSCFGNFGTFERRLFF